VSVYSCKLRKRTISQLSDANEAGHVLVENLESTAVFLRLARVAEAARSVQDAAEGVEVDCFASLISYIFPYTRS
jgi:hypothetical protein